MPGRFRDLTPLTPWALAAVFAALYATLSLRRHARFESTGYDLGIFEQGVQRYAHGQLPVSHIREIDLLGDHFSPVMALLAPVYRLLPGPGTLLVAQAVLMALALVPVARFCLERFGSATAVTTGVAQGLFWGVQEAVWFDVHEICFAVPLLAASAVALVRRRQRAAVAWALPLLLVKEDLGLTVAAVGVVVALQGRRRLGAATVAAGLGGLALVVEVLLPALNPWHRYQYAGTPMVWSGGHLDLAAGQRLALVAFVLGPTLLLAVRSPVALLLVPTLGWRLATASPGYWTTTFHYSAVFAPVLFAAFADALARSRWDGRRITAAATAAAAVALAVTFWPGHARPLARLSDPDFWRDPPRVAARRAAVALVPDGVVVEAGNTLAPHLVSRADVWAFPRSRTAPEPEYAVVDTADTYPLSPDGNRREVARLEARGWRVLLDRDGVVALHRP